MVPVSIAFDGKPGIIMPFNQQVNAESVNDFETLLIGI
jgi:hypothetical protein